MIDTLISSKTRVKLLLKFFLNTQNRAYLRGLEQEFSESSNAIRLELNRLEGAGMLCSNLEGNKKIFQANDQHPLFGEIQSIVRKYVGLDRIINHVVMRLGSVDEVYLAGTFAKGLNGPIIDLVMVGEVDVKYLIELIKKAEGLVDRKIRYVVYGSEDQELTRIRESEENLLIWAQNG